MVIAGLPYISTNEGLSEAFSKFGQIVEANIVVDKFSGRSKGFGFITYASEEEARRAVSEMNGMIFNGRPIFVDYAKPKGYGGQVVIARGPPDEALDGR